MAKYRPERVPKPAFRKIEELDRYKRILLGLPILRSRRDAPWGYRQSSLDSSWLIPDIKALRLLLEAKKHIETCSLQEVARWLTETTGIPISYEGLRIILIERCPLKEIMLSDDERERLYYSPTLFSPAALGAENRTIKGAEITGTQG